MTTKYLKTTTQVDEVIVEHEFVILVYAFDEQAPILNQEVLDLISSGFTIDKFRPATSDLKGIVTAYKTTI